MKPAPAFPAVVPPLPVLTELACAIRFFLGAKRELLPHAAIQAFEWREADFQDAPHRGTAVPLSKLLNGPESPGGDPWLQWRQQCGEDPLVNLLEIAWQFGAAAGLRQLWDMPGATLAGTSRDTMRRLGRKLIDLADFMDTTGPDPHADKIIPEPKPVPNSAGCQGAP